MGKCSECEHGHRECGSSLTSCSKGVSSGSKTRMPPWFEWCRKFEHRRTRYRLNEPIVMYCKDVGGQRLHECVIAGTRLTVTDEGLDRLFEEVTD